MPLSALSIPKVYYHEAKLASINSVLIASTYGQYKIVNIALYNEEAIVDYT